MSLEFRKSQWIVFGSDGDDGRIELPENPELAPSPGICEPWRRRLRYLTASLGEPLGDIFTSPSEVDLSLISGNLFQSK